MSVQKNHFPLTLKIVTPEGSLPVIYCDSILLPVKDDEKGKGGGSYGIRKGHAKALMATASGKVSAISDGETVFSSELAEGFAMIANNTVTVTANTVK